MNKPASQFLIYAILLTMTRDLYNKIWIRVLFGWSARRDSKCNLPKIININCDHIQLNALKSIIKIYNDRCCLCKIIISRPVSSRHRLDHTKHNVNRILLPPFVGNTRTLIVLSSVFMPLFILMSLTFRCGFYHFLMLCSTLYLWRAVG